MRVSGGDLCIRKYAEAPTEPAGETFHAHPSNLANLRNPNGCQPIVGAIHESPEHSRNFHKPNDETQPVGGDDLGAPSTVDFHINPTAVHNP